MNNFKRLLRESKSFDRIFEPRLGGESETFKLKVVDNETSSFFSTKKIELKMGDKITNVIEHPDIQAVVFNLNGIKATISTADFSKIQKFSRLVNSM